MNLWDRLIRSLGRRWVIFFLLVVIGLIVLFGSAAIWKGVSFSIGPSGMAVGGKEAATPQVPKVEIPKDVGVKPSGQFVVDCGISTMGGNVTDNQVFCGPTSRSVTIIRTIAPPPSSNIRQAASKPLAVAGDQTWADRLLTAERAIQDPNSLPELEAFVKVCQSVTASLHNQVSISGKLRDFEKLSSTINSAGICPAFNACFTLYEKSVPFKNVYQCVP